MYYVYHIQSLRYPARCYTNFSADLRQRLADHDAGKNRFTAPFRPWSLIFYAAFRSEQTARALKPDWAQDG